VHEDRWESDLVRELNGVLDAIDGRMKSPPAEFASLRRQVDDAVFHVLLRGGVDALEDVAVCLGRLYRRILLTDKPVWIGPKLSGEWVTTLTEAADQSEARIAAALAAMWDRDMKGISIHLDRGTADSVGQVGTLRNGWHGPWSVAFWRASKRAWITTRWGRAIGPVSRM